MYSRSCVVSLIVSLLVGGAAGFARAQDQEEAAVSAVRKAAEQAVEAFNSDKPANMASKFLPKGELIDEQGTVYQGRKEIEDLLDAFCQQFPGTKLALNIDSIRLVGPVAIDEGTRTMTSADGDVQSRFRYIAVWAKTDEGWQLASFRDFADDPLPSAHDFLQPLAWLVGDWVNEGTDGKVVIGYKWSEDKNYLLGQFAFESAEGTSRKSTQRIGWDASTGKIRSWLFDSDGGFAEGFWTIVEDDIVVKSSAVNPDGSVASATMTITPLDDDHYVIAGTDRIVGNSRELDFEITVARRPPAAGQ